jgi:NAD(P)H-flavin reductase
MIQHELANNTKRNISLVFGVRHEEDSLYRDEWESLKKAHTNFHSTITLSRPQPTWAGQQGYVQTKLEQFQDQKSHLDVYICGLGKMVQEVREKLSQL